MLTKNMFENEIRKYTSDISGVMYDSELVHSYQIKQNGEMLTMYCFLYYNYEDNCIIHFKEVTKGTIDTSGDVVNEQTVGYEILKCYRFV